MATQHNDDSNDSKYVYNKMWSIFDERTAKEFAAHLLPHLKPEHRILDVGCGRGSISLDLAGVVAEGSVLGIDINSTLIDGAIGLAAKRNLSNIKFQVMDATALGNLASKSFDVVHAHQVLFHIPDPIAVLRGLFRVLKPGGILSLRDNASLHYYPELPMMQKYIYSGTELASERGLGFGLWNHYAAQQAGFAAEKIERSSWGWSWEDPQRWVGTAKNSARAALLAKGKMTEAELDQNEKEWDEWALLPQARMQGLDGAVLCWK